MNEKNTLQFKDFEDTCLCRDCVDSENPCHYDCSITRPELCDGCNEMRLEREEIVFESKQVLGII